MRIKKRSILEAANNNAPTNTSNTTGSNQQNTQQTNNQKLPNPEDIKNAKTAIQDLDKEVDKTNNDIKNGPMSAFLKGDDLTETMEPGTGEDFGDLGSSDIEYMADKHDANMADYEGWLNTPEGQDWMNNMDSLDESFKSKRKVIKTIKVKDLK